jgi:hypothetical protein
MTSKDFAVTIVPRCADIGLNPHMRYAASRTGMLTESKRNDGWFKPVPERSHYPSLYLLLQLADSQGQEAQ